MAFRTWKLDRSSNLDLFPNAARSLSALHQVRVIVPAQFSRHSNLLIGACSMHAGGDERFFEYMQR